MQHAQKYSRVVMMRWFYISEWGSYLTFEPSIMNGSIGTKILIKKKKKKDTLHKIRQQLKVNFNFNFDLVQL